MIASLSGTLNYADFHEAVLDVNGVGYLVYIPLSTYDRLPQPGNKANLFTYLNVREDALDLYGFATKEEKELFVLLKSVSGIGPKVALNVLSSMSVERFCSAVASGDVKTVTSLKGLGKKTAERLVLELKNKVSVISPTAEYSSEEKGANPELATMIEEAALALIGLQVRQDVAYSAVRKIASEIDSKELTTQLLITKALTSVNS